MSTSSSTFVIPSIFTWSEARPEHNIDAQVIVGTHEEYIKITLPAPPSAVTYISRNPLSPEEEGTDPIDDFFGVVRPSRSSRSAHGMQDSRHDAATLPVHHDDIPPPSSYVADPPAYSRFEEQPMLAMYLFYFVLVFPLFWIAGALILISPLRAPEDWETSKTETKRQELIGSMRRTEVKWAKRCLLALAVWAVVSVVVILAVAFTDRR